MVGCLSVAGPALPCALYRLTKAAWLWHSSDRLRKYRHRSQGSQTRCRGLSYQTCGHGRYYFDPARAERSENRGAIASDVGGSSALGTHTASSRILRTQRVGNFAASQD